MRHLVLALMIVLLPLRGWAGDVMAVEVASMAVATKIGAAHAHETGATASFEHQNQAFEATQAMPDCHEQLAGHPESDQTAGSDHCGTCQACQVCHTVALSPSSLVVTASFASPDLRPVSAAAFTSASTALGQKPPIA
jgi:hypothetical protein